MLSELAHVLRHAPSTLYLKRKLPQAELYATLIARADAAGLGDKRRQLASALKGHVLEVGCGTGAMFAHYSEGVDRVTGIEPDAAFAELARRAPSRVPVEVIEASGEAIPLPDASIDATVVALVLCSVPSVEKVCREIARVTKPGGEVRLLEHVRSSGVVAGALMHAANPLWLAINGQGCRMNRDPRGALEAAGIAIQRSETFQIWSAGLPAFPMRLIYARRNS